MKCPHCEEVLVMSERQGIEIDYCPKCRGVWLDKGELDKIIERSESGVQQQSPKYDQPLRPTQQDDYYKGDQYDKQKGYDPRRKKRGFLGDLFDFD